MTWMWVIPVIIALTYWAPKELGKERWWLAGAAIGLLVLQSLLPLALAFAPQRMGPAAALMSRAPLAAPVQPEGGSTPGGANQGQRGIRPQPALGPADPFFGGVPQPFRAPPQPFGIRPYRTLSPVWWLLLGLLVGVGAAWAYRRWPVTALGLPGVYLKMRLVRGEITPEEYDSLRQRLTS